MVGQWSRRLVMTVCGVLLLNGCTGETELERCDRHLAELMQEVRVAQTGVQVLFAYRVLFRCGDKHHLVRAANRYAIAGLLCVGLAMVGARSED